MSSLPQPTHRSTLATAFAVFLLFFLFSALVFLMYRLAGPREDLETKRAEARIEKLQAKRDQDKEILENYGWVNEKQQIARMPIQRAMELQVERLQKKPVRAAGPIPPAGSVSSTNQTTQATAPKAAPSPAASTNQTTKAKGT